MPTIPTGDGGTQQFDSQRFAVRVTWHLARWPFRDACRGAAFLETPAGEHARAACIAAVAREHGAPDLETLLMPRPLRELTAITADSIPRQVAFFDRFYGEMLRKGWRVTAGWLRAEEAAL